ncbi:MAG: polysaccharide deacetylase family protein [Bacteroidales bacterium]|nr:polysaccharide deacetylase family protein [Bacteroidales bacterium]
MIPQRIFTVDFEGEGKILGSEQYYVPVREGALEKNLERMLSILESTGVAPSFFVLASTAEKYPNLVKRIAEKYDIGTHSYNHTLVNTQTIKEFSDDLKKSIDTIEQLTGKKVNKYRSPGFSLSSPEYMEQLIENGIEIDCSLASTNHFYGQKTTNLQTPHRIQLQNGIIKEFPITTFKCLWKNIGFTGGGYFRLFPYPMIKHTTKNQPYTMAYIHVSDIDSNKTKIKGLPYFVQFRRLVGTKGAEKKLIKWLNDFDFVDVNTANEKINWDKQPIISAY